MVKFDEKDLNNTGWLVSGIIIGALFGIFGGLWSSATLVLYPDNARLYQYIGGIGTIIVTFIVMIAILLIWKK